jgi:hypothetical protein
LLDGTKRPSRSLNAGFENAGGRTDHHEHGGFEPGLGSDAVRIDPPRLHWSLVHPMAHSWVRTNESSQDPMISPTRRSRRSEATSGTNGSQREASRAKQVVRGSSPLVGSRTEARTQQRSPTASRSTRLHGHL